MRGHYTYNPYTDAPVLKSVVMLQTIWRSFNAMAEALAFIRELQDTHYSMPDALLHAASAFDVVTHLIREMRYSAKSYYETWMLYGMVRYAVLETLDIDISRLAPWHDLFYISQVRAVSEGS